MNGCEWYFLDLGGDLQGVEERDLGWVHTGGSWGDDDIRRCDSSDFRCGFYFVGFDLWLELEHWNVGENQAHLVVKQVFEGVEFLDGSSESLKILIIGVVFLQLLDSSGQHSSDHGLLDINTSLFTFFPMRRYESDLFSNLLIS